MLVCLEYTFQIDALNCSALPVLWYYCFRWLLAVRYYYGKFLPPARPHGINQYSFLVYLLDLRNRVTVTFWTSLLLVNSSACCALVSSFCSSGCDFAIASSLPHFTAWNLQVAFEFVGNYASADFHRRALICPSYKHNTKTGFSRSPPLC